MWWFAVGCVEPVIPPAQVRFEPAAVGFGFDGIVLSDGTLTDYVLDGALYSPTLFEAFASQAFVDGEADDDETCVTWGTFAPAPLETPLATDDGSALLVSYEGTVPISATTCFGRVDPEVWGEDASGLWAALDGAPIGFGIGPQVPELEKLWTPGDLAAVGDAMLAGWFALTSPADTTGTTEALPPAVPLTTLVAYEIDPVTLDPIVQLDANGFPVLVPLDVTTWVPGEPLDPFYVRSTPVVYRSLTQATDTGTP